jgi:hypothetical protein
VDLRDLRHVLGEVVTPALFAAQEGRPGTRPRLAKLHQAAQELMPEAWVDFEGRALLAEILAHTHETADLHALREAKLAAFADLLRRRISQLEAQGAHPSASEAPGAAPRAPAKPTTNDEASADGAPRSTGPAGTGLKARRPWLLGAGLGSFVVFGALGARALISRSEEQDCPSGFYRRGDACVSPDDPLERYANCILRDVKTSTSSDKGTLVQVKVDEAKRGAASALEVKNKFEQSVESNTDRCVVLDVSARCFALATGDKNMPALPRSCMEGALPEQPSAQPSAQSPRTQHPSAPPSPPCVVDLATFNLGKPKCPDKSKSRVATDAEARQLATIHRNCGAFTVVSCEP